MKNIADHLFDIFENSVNAAADEVIIRIAFSDNIFYCSISDNGIGIAGDEVLDPFVTSRTTRKVGLGLPLLKKAAEDTGGYLRIKRINQDGGTNLEFEMNMSHIDAKPFGDLPQTFTDIYFAWPEIDLKIYIINDCKKDKVLDFYEIREDERKGLSNSIKNRRKILSIMQEEMKKLNIE
ncbi:MAG: ATP-binding protein [Candidatus Caldatribacteriota bacterium]|nr:ATP-binding protein [Verrucomicrobiota bacterium]MDD2353412.1 ATP-binding protein [Atribacterota bacterium]MDD4765272.1 ATP-binding protein [Atribacterota bacterium]MDI9597425.1 ATP-binding protein [Atribacterota bacterium]